MNAELRELARFRAASINGFLQRDRGPARASS
jgi:hypothetical protein